ncbi:hypothetical protein BS50DRAFT_643287 [Corynespora cassiicola Philippines]|uniref:Uncharacterized protein n=1 Tax=Corynespora cassiicola Philippines TaxID=1448308 RepID=A0A2T2PBP9_CORCC|nr:hypothetical protein BS50DRAFT_643287 [Corynespora cassiicola Philippines]
MQCKKLPRIESSTKLILVFTIYLALMSTDQTPQKTAKETTREEVLPKIKYWRIRFPSSGEAGKKINGFTDIKAIADHVRKQLENKKDGFWIVHDFDASEGRFLRVCEENDTKAESAYGGRVSKGCRYFCHFQGNAKSKTVKIALDKSEKPYNP